MEFTIRRLLMILLFASVPPAQAGKVTYIYTDHQGTPLAEVDSQGNITTTFEYKPYGMEALGAVADGTPGYAGHVNDRDTALVYMQTRYYDPSIGSFLSTDPAGLFVGSIFSFGRYNYASNNPIINVDPDGRQSMSAIEIGRTFNQALIVKDATPRAVARANEMNVTQAKAVALALTAAPVIGAVSRTAYVVAIDSAAHGSLAAGLALNGSSVTATASLVAEGVAAANGAMTPVSPQSAVIDAEVSLTGQQAANLARFESKLPSGNTGVYVDSLGKGVVFTSSVPGKVPGSYAVYQKMITAEGDTAGYLKTTFSPNGDVVHIKDKINNTPLQSQ